MLAMHALLLPDIDMESKILLTHKALLIKVLQRILIAVTAVILASLVRKYFLASLDDKVVWITFYPAVMFAAIIGGYFSGLLAAVFTMFIVVFQYSLFIDTPFIKGNVGTISVTVFFINCNLISAISEYSRKQKIKADIQKNKAEHANKAKSVFLANMSHELRTPLNAILGFTNILQKSGDSTPEQVKKLNIISNSGKNLLNLINNVLDISKIEAGHMETEDAVLNLKQLLSEIESLMSIKVKEKGLIFKMDLQPDLPAYIILDSGKLRQVLLNLIANAVKYTDKGTISLKVETVQANSENKSMLRFEVNDTGIGICKEFQKNIFDPFEQIGIQPADNSGTGLGLAISKQFVELMDGAIGLESEPDKGSLFFFEVPLNIGDASNERYSEISHIQIKSIAEGQKKFRILIAEDKLENRLLLRNILDPLDFDIREVINGQDAVSEFKNWKPHLIFMDIRLPVMSGLDATRLIKKSKAAAKTKIVALTAHALEEEGVEILEAGCDQFIRKPYSDSDIFDVLKKQLNVKFVYENPIPKKIEKQEDLDIDIEDLKKVPTELLKNLKNAVVQLDEQSSLKSAEIIGNKNYKLGNQIQNLIRKMKYNELLTFIDKLI